MKQFYYFNWNTTDSAIKQRQKLNYQKLLEIWLENTEETFRCGRNYLGALILTHQNLMNIFVMEGFIIFRDLVKITSKIILLDLVAPSIAETLSNWGCRNEPWSLASFHENHENIINR
jgi:hypothetical protein